MAERLVLMTDYTQGIPPEIRSDALRKITQQVGKRHADSAFNESCRLLVEAIREKEAHGSTPSTFTTQDVRALSSAFTVWGVSKKTAETLVRVVLNRKP